ncbi:MAG: substrate-binding domain-containing protein [Aggregatilineales bacterium]
MFRKSVFVVMMALLMAGIGMAQDAEPIRIGLLVDQSGPLTIYGIEQENGFMLGLEYATNGTMEIGGRPIEVIVRDNASSPDDAASQARELLESEGVEVLVGTVSSGATLQLIPIADDFDVILMAGPAASPSITSEAFDDNVFRVCRNSFHDFLALATYAPDAFGTQFAQLAADYEFGRASAGAAETILSGAGIEFPSETIFAPLETTDFTLYLQQLVDTGADAAIVSWAGDGTVTLFQQIDELGIADDITIIGAFNSNEIVAAQDPSTIGTVSWMIYHYSLPDNDINDWMVERHKEDHDGDVPDLFTECSFATAQALVAGLEATEGDTLPEAMIPALEGLSFEGPKGTYTIRPSDHQALVPMYIAELVSLDDPDLLFYELLDTISPADTAPPCLVGEERCAMDEGLMDSMMDDDMGDMDDSEETEESDD